MKRKISKLIFSVCAVSAIVIGLTGSGKAFAQSEPFIGQISYVGFNFAPRNWAQCNGQLLPISENQPLFALISTLYGGDGRTNFALPDMRGRVPVHQGQGPGLSPYRMGQRGGYETIALDISTLPSHAHSASASSDSTSSVSGSAGGATLNAYNGDGNKATAAGNSLANLVKVKGDLGTPAVYSDQAPNTPMKAGSVSVDLSGISVTTTTDTTVTIGNTGGSAKFPIMQPYLVVNCIIALDGIFPQRQ